MPNWKKVIVSGSSAHLNQITGSGGIKLPDAVRLNFGDANDMKIYHSGTHSIIQDTGTGNLELKGSIVKIRGTSGGDNALIYTEDAAVELYYDGSKKLETVNTGVNVTGAITGSGFVIGGHRVSDIDIGGEFNDVDDHVMTSAAVQDKILGYSYSTTTGTVTSVGTTGTVNGLTLSGTVTTSGNLTLGGTLAINNGDWSGTDLAVEHGGTGASTFTDGGILFGNGTDAIQASAVLAAGEILIGDGTTEPTILDVGSASGIEILGTIGTGVWNGTEIGLGYGGTELVGETDGKIVVADGNGAPVHLDIGSSTAITILGTIATGTWEATDVEVAHGGTGASTFTDGGVLLGSGTDPITATAVLTNGQLLIGDNSGDPTVGTLTGTSNQITVTNGGGSITLSTPQSIDTGADVTFGTVRVDDTTTSTSKTTGALIVDGGLGVNENIHAGGDVVAYASSDERLKDNIEVIESSLDKVGEIRGVTFNWNEESPEWAKERGRDVGVIAQEVRKVLPEIVVERTNGYLGVDYKRIIPLLIESIKELKQEVEDLKKKVN